MVTIHLCIDTPAVAERIASAVRLAGFEPREIGDPRSQPAVIVADGPLPGGPPPVPLVLIADSAGPEAQAALDAGAVDLIDPRTPLPLTARRLRRLVDHRVARGAGEHFLRRVTHDLKSPLLNMRQMARFLAEDEPDLSPSGQRFAQRIASNAQRMTRLVERLAKLVDLSNTSLRIMRCDPTAVVREAFDAGLQLVIPAAVPEVWVDLARFGQLVREVAENAQQAGAGQLTLTATLREPMLELVFTDDGPGLAPAQLERVLAPMVRLHSDERRAGLGLSIARRVAEIHDGELWLSLPAAGGLAVHVTLPMRL